MSQSKWWVKNILIFKWSDKNKCYALKFDQQEFGYHFKTHCRLFIEQLKQIPRDMWEYVGDINSPDYRTWYIAEQKFNDVKQLIDFFFSNTVDPVTGQRTSLPYSGKPPLVMERPPVSTTDDDTTHGKQFVTFHSKENDFTTLCDLFTKAGVTNGNGAVTVSTLKSKPFTEVKKLYFKTAMLFHPDRNPGDIQRATWMAQLNEVYTRLKEQDVWTK